MDLTHKNASAAMKHTIESNGSQALLLKVRAAFTEAGVSLRAWCISEGVDPSHAHRVLVGSKNGPAATALRNRLIAAASKEAA